MMKTSSHCGRTLESPAPGSLFEPGQKRPGCRTLESPATIKACPHFRLPGLPAVHACQGRRPDGRAYAAALRKKAGGIVLGMLLCFSFLALAQNRAARDEAVSFAIAGEYQRAYDIFRSLLHDAPDDPLLNYYTGAACVRMNRQAEGIEYLERAVRREAPFPQAYQELAEAYLKKKLNPQAEAVVEKGLGRFPRNQALQKLQARLRKSKPER